MSTPADDLQPLLTRRAQLGAQFDTMVAAGAPLADLDANRAEARHLSRLIADLVEARVGI